MPIDKVNYFNQIDIGIFIYFLEMCLGKNNIKYIRELYIEKDSNAEYNLTAEYFLKKK